MAYTPKALVSPLDLPHIQKHNNSHEVSIPRRGRDRVETKGEAIRYQRQGKSLELSVRSHFAATQWWPLGKLGGIGTSV
jgi:hypothetical protein